MTDPAAEAAFAKWVDEHTLGTANVHTAFVAGRASALKGETMPDPQKLTQGRIVRYYPVAGGHGYPAIVTRVFPRGDGYQPRANLTVFIDGVNGAQDGFAEEDWKRGAHIGFSVPHEESPDIDPTSPRWGWPPRD